MCVCCCGSAADKLFCYAAIRYQAVFASPRPLPFLSTPSFKMAAPSWTGSEAELVGESVAEGDSPKASDVQLVSSSEAWELVPTKKEVKA